MNDREAYEFYADPANQVPAGPPRKRKAPRLTNMASVRFDPAVIGAATAIAHEEGMTVSSWIRRLVQRETEPPRMAEVACDGPKALPSSLELKRGFGVTTETGSTLTGRTFACPHLAVGNAVSVSCGICGPLMEAG